MQEKDGSGGGEEVVVLIRNGEVFGCKVGANYQSAPRFTNALEPHKRFGRKPRQYLRYHLF